MCLCIIRVKWILFFVLTVGALFLTWRAVRQAPRTGATRTAAVSPSVGGNALREETHYSPFENLEALDYRALGGAKHRIDIAMYAMTDRYLASELTSLADRGVAIRIYRDGEQWQTEMRNGRHDTIADLLRGHAGIHIRVKPPSRSELMHLKEYLVDGTLLRDGSANWSPAGLREQDNEARFTGDPRQIEAFEARFDAMWKRTSNLFVQ